MGYAWLKFDRLPAALRFAARPKIVRVRCCDKRLKASLGVCGRAVVCRVIVKAGHKTSAGTQRSPAMTILQTAAVPNQATYANDDVRWNAVMQRDPAADGRFWFAVSSTGVYCRPSCAARRPRRENVRFYANRPEAERAGYRPCRRCRPDEASSRERQLAAIAQACRAIEAAEVLPSLDDLAQAAGMSRFHFHRVFRSIAGVTPKAYADAYRGGRLRDELRRSDTVTEAIYDSGFGSNGRFYASAPSLLGMTPTAFRTGGRGASIRFAIAECWLGSILVAASERGVCAILLGNDPETLTRDLQGRFAQATLIGGDREFEEIVAQVVAFVETPSRGLDLPLDIRGTAFQRRVWQALREIPAGATASYGEIATRLGHPEAAQEVGRACAANSLAVAIPCHRVVRTDGSLSGYRWGVERKRALLRREAS
jgi:AraC family transcriptional regulator of adaptative response/methylated-DNA-[protein]-cysteine methyltransferase